MMRFVSNIFTSGPKKIGEKIDKSLSSAYNK